MHRSHNVVPKFSVLLVVLIGLQAPPVMHASAKEDGDGSVRVHGELRQWHKVTLDLRGPWADEAGTAPNPFVDFEFEVRFTHESGAPYYVVPGYFAADGNAAESSATAGNVWRAHLAPDLPGTWHYQISFRRGPGIVATGRPSPQTLAPYHGIEGNFMVAKSNKQAPDFRARGRLRYTGQRYLQFAGTGEYFLKAGADAPETLLAYQDFDGTVAGKKNVPLKTWQPHIRDWRPGDPQWKGGRGKGLIGAVNYLADSGCNAMSFLPYNAGGDGDNVWPFVARNDKLHYDCSKLDQWGIVFDHATTRGIFLHFKLQETEIDDNRRGAGNKLGAVPTSLDGGKLGPERRLYLRELVARYGHLLALNWNLGEENTQSTDEQLAMIGFLRQIDPYDHPIVVHTYPNQQDRVYTPLLGKRDGLDGVSLQNSWRAAHQRTLKWVRASKDAGRSWVVCNDEQNPASHGVPPDPGYRGFDGFAEDDRGKYTLHDIRQATLWGTLLAGGAGVEYYFGYKLPENDLVCEDFRSRAQSWRYCRIALQFFRQHDIPFPKMECHDGLVRNPRSDNSAYCFAKPGEVYLVYLPQGGQRPLDLTAARGNFAVKWFNPRQGGSLVAGTPPTVGGGEVATLQAPTSGANEDWLAIVRRMDGR